jgi:hypothetical protein
MKFHVAVMQYTGDITDRAEHTLAKLQGIDLGRRMIAGFETMLEEHLPQLLEGVVQIGLPVFEGRGRLEWRQPDVFSATAAFFLGEQVKFTWFLFAGHDPVADAIAVDATAKCIRGLASDAGVTVQPDAGLRSIRERPAAVCVPWPPSASDLDRRLVGNMAVFLAAAFFHTADQVAARGRAVWESYQKWMRETNRDGLDN